MALKVPEASRSVPPSFRHCFTASLAGEPSILLLWGFRARPDLAFRRFAFLEFRISWLSPVESASPRFGGNQASKRAGEGSYRKCGEMRGGIIDLEHNTASKISAIIQVYFYRPVALFNLIAVTSTRFLDFFSNRKRYIFFRFVLAPARHIPIMGGKPESIGRDENPGAP